MTASMTSAIVSNSTSLYNPDSCGIAGYSKLLNNTCVPKLDAQIIACSILRNSSSDTDRVAKALSLYISSVTNSTVTLNTTSTLSADEIDNIVKDLTNINLSLSSNTSFIAVQQPNQDENSMVLGASFKRGIGGDIIDTNNEVNVTDSFITAAVIVNRESLNGVTSLNLLIIDKPTEYENIDNSTNKTLTSSVIVVNLQRDDSAFSPLYLSLYFKLIEEYIPNGIGKYLCSFYNTTTFIWSETGCSSAFYNQQFNRYECNCTHTTSFALVWLPQSLLTETSSKTFDAQDIASLITQLISIICFLIIMIHATGIRIINPLIGVQALNLLPLISTASTTILFSFYIALSLTVYTQTSSSYQTECFSSSGVLMFITYFFLIFMFCVKTITGYFYFLRFVRLFPQPSHRKLLIMLIISFLISSLCTILAIGLNTNSSYNITQLYPYELCWFNSNVIYYFMTIPICLFLFFNIITIILVSNSLFKHARSAATSKQINERLKRCAIVLLSSCVTQGIGWIFGPFISFIGVTAGEVLAWIFIILNGLEGVWSILLYILIRTQQMDEQKHVVAAIELSKTSGIPLKKNEKLNGKRRDPIRIQVYLMITSLGPIAELDMSYTMNLFFRQVWTDERLTLPNKISNVAVSTKLLSAIWKPDTYFINSRSGFLHTTPTLNHLLRILENGRLLYSSRLTIKASCSNFLRRFPLDIQTCPFILSSYAYGTEDVIYDWKLDENNGVELVPLKLSQFDLFHYKTSKRIIQFNDRNHSVLQLDLSMRRNAGYYILQGYIPASLLVILSWISFWINSDATADRVYIGVTCVLSLTTLILDIRSYIPAVPYFTAIDYFFIMCYLFLFASVIQLTAVHCHLDYRRSIRRKKVMKDLSRTSDRQKTSPKINLSVQNIRQLNPTQRSTFAGVVQRLQKLQQKAPLHEFDRLARIGFPLLFTLCNCIYWYIFVFYTSQ
ncbi:unnamed protein product [Adineta steineri]|uniref:G-protein coupled receptors family 2 profile 2 domain-containing protein n=1 Tax=Adineta steineri TaxID=433720 RepID=A0A815H3U5_9BILA|nr:unnamed protein product [Adineta steineri]